MSSNKKYWRSVEELDEKSTIVETLKQNEFVEEIPVDEFLGNKSALGASSTTRRDFLKYVGFSTAAASLAACEGPVVKSIPYVVQPDQIIPGVANYYASSIANGYDFANILVKTREGRPIKILSNDLATASAGANARVNASVLDLYDSYRVPQPKKNGEDSSWAEFDAETTQKLKELRDSGKEIVLLTQTFASPSTSQLISEFKEAYGNVRHVIYDAISESAAADAYQIKYGERALPHYDFSKATTIVSIGADFLGDWQGGGYSPGYAKGRVPKNGKMSRHIQFESNMTLSGGNADKRVPLKPSEQKIALAKLYGKIMGRSVSGSLPDDVNEAVNVAAAQLLRAGNGGLVVTGIQDVNAQMLALAINEKLASKAFDPSTPVKTRQGDDKAVAKLIDDMKTGTIGAVIMCGVNPLYSLPNASDFSEGLEKTELTIAFSMKENETTSNVDYLAAESHYLESWGDLEIKKGHYGLMQPAIRTLFDTRQFQEALLKWNGNDVSYHDYIKTYWNSNILNGSSWDQTLHDGVFVGQPTSTETTSSETSVETQIEDQTSTLDNAANMLASATSGDFELTLYPKIGMGDGKQANNPWLQEFPDPITRVSWDNYLTISKDDADKLGIENYHVSNGALNGSLVELTLNGVSISIPAFIQPGQANGSVGLALGYGRKLGLKTEMQVGENAYRFYTNFDPVQSGATIKVIDGEHEYACVQLQNTMAGREEGIIRETTLEVFNTEDREEWNEIPEVSYDHNEISVREQNADIWVPFDESIGHHFNMSIDLNACTGCGACVIACHSENNVPVVGKNEVRKFRDMHWLRIDRYYSSADTFKQEVEDLENL
ncbi:MAG TPA: TAT-variant-translocated molybdopterin oxidoreductase, partial [Flavobacteriaceae bacterium]|nr:TAT-variant-translocated molybdopterin oxidoreductase [Flavobacteriaceae bacterium]